MKRFQIAASFLALGVLAGSAVLAGGAQEKLDAESRKFLSEVRYIITEQENKVFLELPSEARPRFVEDFWLRRDPTPETEENEFQEAYYGRIEEANRLFRGSPRGWLQDRGRYYILFGPPNERRANPMGGRPIDATDDHRDLTGGISAATGEKGSEVWTYYNLFSTLQKPQVVELMFVDSDGTGNYRLVTNLQQLIPGGIDSLLKPDMELTHELYKEENLRTRRGRWVLFDFDWEFLKQEDTAAGSNLAVSVSLPHRRIVFEVEGERLRAELRLTVQVRDAAGKTVGAASFEDRLELERSALEEDPNARWTASVPVTPRLAKGRYRAYLRLDNAGGDQSVEKLLTLKL